VQADVDSATRAKEAADKALEDAIANQIPF